MTNNSDNSAAAANISVAPLVLHEATEMELESYQEARPFISQVDDKGEVEQVPPLLGDLVVDGWEAGLFVDDVGVELEVLRNRESVVYRHDQIATVLALVVAGRLRSITTEKQILAMGFYLSDLY